MPLPTQIYAGNDVTNRASFLSGGNTYLDRLVTLTANGYLSKVNIWTTSNLTYLYVGLFRQVSGTTYKCVAASGNLGAVSSGALREFNVFMYGKAGDVLGFIGSSNIEADTSGGDVIYVSGNKVTLDLESNFTSSFARVSSVKLLGYDILSTNMIRSSVSYEIGTIVETGDSVMPIEEISPTPQTENTPFIESIQEGTDIVLKAPLVYEGWLFGFWRIIGADGSESQNSNAQATITISQETEIRAIYFRQMYRESVEYVVGPIYLTDNNISEYRETVEYVIT